MKKIIITTESNIEGFSGHFRTVEVEVKEQLSIRTIPNYVALAVARKAFDTGEKHKFGMWVAEVER